MKKCHNYLLCSDYYEHNCDGHISEIGLCWSCETSINSYIRKKAVIKDGFYPSIIEYSCYDFKHNNEEEYHSQRMEKIESEEIKQQLLIKLEKNKYITGILKIEEINNNCPICLEDKKIFITHPTCGIHKFCKECFHKTFKYLEHHDMSDLFEEENEEEYYLNILKESENIRCCNICREKLLKI